MKNKKEVTFSELSASLREDGLSDKGLEEDIKGELEKEGRSTPLYVKFISGLGAWIAAPFLLFGLFMVFSAYPSRASILSMGSFLLVVATVGSRLKKGVFLDQLSLALGLAGHFGLIYGFDEYQGTFIMPAIVHTVSTLIFYPFFRNEIYRFITPLVAGIFWILVSYELGQLYLINIVLLIEVMGAGWLLLRAGRSSIWGPLGTSLATCALLTLFIIETAPIIGFMRLEGTSLLTFPRLIVTAGTVMLITRMGGTARLKQEWMVIAIVAALLIGLFASPAVLAAIAVMALGYGARDNITLAVGTVFLPAFITAYYYSLEVGLAYKSYVLAGSGLVLLLARWILSKRPWAKEVAA